MPTPARFLCAILFAYIGWQAAQIAVAQLPPEQVAQARGVDRLAAIFGAITGWRFVGSRAGQGARTAFATGMTGGALLFFTVMATSSAVLMIRASTRFAYSDPLEATVDAIRIGIEKTALVSTPELYALLLGGGVLAAMVGEGLNRRWS